MIKTLSGDQPKQLGEVFNRFYAIGKLKLSEQSNMMLAGKVPGPVGDAFIIVCVAALAYVIGALLLKETRCRDTHDDS